MEDSTLAVLIKWGELVRIFIIPILGYAAYIVREIKKDVEKLSEVTQLMSERVARLEVRLEYHEDHDDQRFRHHGE